MYIVGNGKPKYWDSIYQDCRGDFKILNLHLKRSVDIWIKRMVKVPEPLPWSLLSFSKGSHECMHYDVQRNWSQN